jgi:bifunctional DNA-binding transcriptional regulator/antitoxin component of YhaV-PrlF toxin-antitoxin module
MYNENVARRKRENYLTRSLNKISDGKSYSITLPVEVIRRFRWQKRQKLQIRVDESHKKIIIEDWKG